MHRSLFAGPLLAVTLGLAACAPRAAGPHPQDFVLEEGQQYEKNADVALQREYWIVVSAEDGTRFMLPRPDGDPRVVAECGRGTPLAATFQNAKLCESANGQTLARVNALSKAEAMKTSTFLHGKLAFVVSGDRTRVEPYPLASDLLDVCKTYPDERSGALRSVCDDELRYESANGRPSIARSSSAAENAAITSRLNDLYGIAR